MRTQEKGDVEWFLQVISFIQRLAQTFIEHLLQWFSECGPGTSSTRDSGDGAQQHIFASPPGDSSSCQTLGQVRGCQVSLTSALPSGAWSPGRRQTGKNEILSAGKELLSKGWRPRGSWHGFGPGAGGPGKDG